MRAKNKVRKSALPTMDPAPPQPFLFDPDAKPGEQGYYPAGHLEPPSVLPAAAGEKNKNWFELYLEANKDGELFRKPLHVNPSAPPFTYKWDREGDDIRMLDLTKCTGASVPPGETILVVAPSDQLYKDVQCHACGVTKRTETRFNGVYTCGGCQWKGLAPLKQPESVVNQVVIEEEKSKEGRKSTKEPCKWCVGGCPSCRDDTAVPPTTTLTTTTKEVMSVHCRICNKALTLPGMRLGAVTCVACQKRSPLTRFTTIETEGPDGDVTLLNVYKSGGLDLLN